MTHDFKGALNALENNDLKLGLTNQEYMELYYGWHLANQNTVKAALELAIIESQKCYCLADTHGQRFMCNNCIAKLEPTIQQPAAYKDPQGSQDD